MLKKEKKLFLFIKEHNMSLFIIIITILAVIVRISGKDFVSADMRVHPIPWYETMQKDGLKALKNQVGDYNLLYQTIIVLLGYLKIKSIYLYKILSIIFDFFLAFTCGYVICKMTNKKWRKSITFIMVYSIVLFTPTVIMNSAFWGQCDSIYSSFLIWTIYLLYCEKYRMSFLLWGLAMSFKFQSIFILPFILYVYFYRKKFSILNIGYSIIVFWCSGLVAYLQGRGLLDGFIIYLKQTVEYPQMYLNFPSFWMILGNDYTNLKVLAIVMTVFVLGIGCLGIIRQAFTMDSGENFLKILCWTLWSILLLLPAMHDRYAYMLDVILIMLCFFNKHFIFLAFTEILLSTSSYGVFLFANDSLGIVSAIVNIVMWILFSTCVFGSGESCIKWSREN